MNTPAPLFVDKNTLHKATVNENPHAIIFGENVGILTASGHNFPMRPANAISIAGRKRVRGVGINDAPYVTQPTVDGQQRPCPYLQKWENMMTRGYSEKYHEKHPSYIGSSIHPPWLYFMEYRTWLAENGWTTTGALAIDKDILYPANKRYSPDRCVLVPQALNSLLLDRGADRGEWPRGVYWKKDREKFSAEISKHGKRYYLGLFDTPEQASAAYIEAKSIHIFEVAAQLDDRRLRDGLIANMLVLQGVAPASFFNPHLDPETGLDRQL